VLHLRDLSSAPAEGAVAPERTPFMTLWRTFITQFWTSETVTSDAHLRQAIASIVAFLIVPGVFLLIELFPEFQSAVVRAQAGVGPMSRIDDLLAWMTFLLTTYSMVFMGFLTVLSWDSLTFSRRDAMVLGPLPLRHPTILSAKLSALAALLLVGTVPINLLNALVFAMETSDQATASILFHHFVAFFAATVGAGVLSFAAIVMIRGAVSSLGGPWLTAACGPPLQFLCVVGLLSLVMSAPFVLHVSFMTARLTNWMPPAWFVGLFEHVRGSVRVADPAFPFATLARRALVVTPAVVIGAFVLSVIEFHRQMRLALAPSADPGVLGRAHVSRSVAKLIVGRDSAAYAMTEFILLTLARNRTQQAPIAINVALGAALIVAALVANTHDVASLMHPRTATLWIPLMVAYWMTIGLRASFYVPSELPASWWARTHGDGSRTSIWSAVRAAMIAFVLPRTMVVTVLLVPILGWRLAGAHAFVVAAVVVLFIEIIVRTVEQVPFTRPYRPGHAKLKSRWPLYVAGVYLVVYVPARVILRWGVSTQLFEMVGLLIAAIIVLDMLGRRRVDSNLDEPYQEPEVTFASDFTVLDLPPGALLDEHIR